MQQKSALGKGLGALIGATEKTMLAGATAKTGVMEVDLTSIEPNKDQPRKYFEEEALSELSESIRKFGVIQPLIVAEEYYEDGTPYYKIVAGERRWRAARLAGLKTLPVVVKNYSNEQILEVSIIENIQRENLSPIEEAMSYRRLAEEFSLTQEEIASKVGKKRNTITYAMGLLALDLRVQNFIGEGKITPGHARAIGLIKNHEGQFLFAQKIIDEDLTTREATKLQKEMEAMEKLTELVEETKETVEEKQTEDTAPIFASIESDLQTILGASVSIVNGKKKGKIEIAYHSSDELDRLIAILKKLR